MNRVPLVVSLVVTVGAACSEPVATTIPQLNLDRPVDISFACYGPLTLTAEANAVIDSAQPVSSCEARSPQVVTYDDEGDPIPTTPPGQNAANPPRWFGFILQAPGTVALASWPVKAVYDAKTPSNDLAQTDFTVLDTDPLTPGHNAINVGEDPVGIVSDRSGCFQVTANAGSCDLSTIDVASAVDGSPSTPVVVRRVDIKNARGETIRARPVAMVAEPGDPVATVGNRCPASSTGLIYVAYPSCHLVAAVDTATGTIVSGIQFDAAGVATVTDGNVSCIDECRSAGSLPGPFTSGGRPVALDLEHDPRTNTRRLAIGMDNVPTVTVVDLDAASRPVAGAPLQIALENTGGKLGVSALSLSPTMTTGGAGGTNNDRTPPVAADEAQYVYAVATDDTVRVVDVLGIRQECDTQIDPRFVRAINDRRQLQCFPVGAPTNPIRRALARGPGIELPDRGAPTSVTIIKGLTQQLKELATGQTGVLIDTPLNPGMLIGYFAVISSSSGAAYVVNVDDDASAADVFTDGMEQATAPSLVMAHQLRDALANRGEGPPDTEQATCDVGNPPLSVGGANAGGPRGTEPLSNARGGLTGLISDKKALELPLLRQVSCSLTKAPPAELAQPVSEVQFTADPTIRDEVFPDLGATRTEQWTLTWEGALSADGIVPVDGPIVRSAKMRVDQTGMYLADQARPYCEVGVEPFDIVQFRGCNPVNGGGDCPAGYDCFVHPESELAVGACMLSTEAERLANACRDFLVSQRHYTVARATSGELQLLPRKRVLRTTPIDGCTTSAQCEVLADQAARAPSSLEPFQDTTTDPRTWECLADDQRAPVNSDPAQNKRCIQTCGFHSVETDGMDRDIDCGANLICQGAAAGGVRGVCMEGVTPPQACVNGPQRFQIHASEAFTLIGTRSGYIHPFIADPSGQCVVNPAANPVQKGRIPLTAPACTTTADKITGQLPGGGFEANPCSEEVPHLENQPNYEDPQNCVLNATTPVIPRTRNAPAIKLRTRNMTLRLVDPFYPGDARCTLDRLGNQGKIPRVFSAVAGGSSGYQLLFNQTGGFTPLALSVAPSYPVKIVRGPSDSIWVVDDGDFLSTQLGRPSSRGGVFRVDPAALFQVYALE
jgi:hypothetical protein